MIKNLLRIRRQLLWCQLHIEWSGQQTYLQELRRRWRYSSDFTGGYFSIRPGVIELSLLWGLDHNK